MPRPLLVVLCFVLPTIANAQVILSEIAWMGTVENFRCEWIELYNSGSEDIDVGAWRIQIGSGQERVLSPDTQLIIPAHEYLVVERLVPSCPDPVPGINGIMLAFGDIPNSDTSITLFSSNGQEDRVLSGTDWEGKGDNTTKETAQRRGSVWVTATPTPGAQTPLVSATPIHTDTSTSTSTSSSLSGAPSDWRTSGAPRANPVRTEKTTISYKDTVLELSLNAPLTAYVNQPVHFEVVPTGAGKTILNSLRYDWNFGDFNTAHTKTPVHTFAYEGEYIVIVEAEFATRKATIRSEITVLPVTVTLTRTASGDIVIHNTASYEVNLSGYTLTGQMQFVFPKHSFVKAGGKVTVPMKRIGTAQEVVLTDNALQHIASVGTVPAAQPVRLVLAQTQPSSHVPVSAPPPPAPEKISSERTFINLDISTTEGKGEKKKHGFLAPMLSLAAIMFGADGDDF